MASRFSCFKYFFYTLTLISSQIDAHAQTVGLFSHASGSEDDGYVLFAPVVGSDTTYLIDKCGRRVHTWAGDYTPGLDVYLLPDGTLLKSGHYPNPVFDSSGVSDGGIIERYDWEGHLLWHYIISNPMETQNHDICYLPNGNILVAIWDVISDSAAISYGRNPATLGPNLWGAKVIEIQPVGTDSANIVWQWRIWDHLIQDYDATKPNYGVVADHPELLNLNYTDYTYTTTTSDWLHLNAVTYNPSLDQVMISAHNINEIWILDHSTDSVAAATHTGGKHNKGGDFLYRWGNPAVYNRGSTSDTKLFQQHAPSWITSGKYVNQVMIFNNGLGRPGGNASSVDIINPPVDIAGNYMLASGAAFGPDSLTWTYEAPVPAGFFSNYMGGAQPLPNGNTLICEAVDGRFFEIDSFKKTVWDYVNPVDSGKPVNQGTVSSNNSVYRCTFYPSSYSGLTVNTVSPGTQPIELNPLSYSCNISYQDVAPLKLPENVVEIFPNPANDLVKIKSGNQLKSVKLLDLTGRTIIDINYNYPTTTGALNTSLLPDGTYIVCVNNTTHQRVIIRH